MWICHPVPACQEGKTSASIYSDICSPFKWFYEKHFLTILCTAIMYLLYIREKAPSSFICVYGTATCIDVDRSRTLFICVVSLTKCSCRRGAGMCACRNRSWSHLKGSHRLMIWCVFIEKVALGRSGFISRWICKSRSRVCMHICNIWTMLKSKL